MFKKELVSLVMAISFNILIYANILVLMSFVLTFICSRFLVFFQTHLEIFNAIYMQVSPGIILGNGETICDIPLLLSLGVTHVLNVAEEHVNASSTKLAVRGIQYHGFHVDDLPECDISR